MAVPVDIFVLDDSLAQLPIQSVVVQVLNPSTYAIVASGTTGVDGRAAFTLPGAASPGTEYEVRAFKLGVIFSNPFKIAVVDPVVTTNKFDLAGTKLDLPVATDPRCCRCTGRFMDFRNLPIPNVSFRVSAINTSGKQTPKVVDGNIISPDTMLFSSDKDGYVSLDLVRSGQYYVTFSGEEDVNWLIYVPDRASVNLIDLIHPYPVSLSWDQTDAPGNSVSVQISQVKTVRYALTMSDYRVVDEGGNTQEVVQVWNSNPDIASVGAGDSMIGLKGVSSGTVSVTATLKEVLSPYRVPFPVLSYTPLSVSVVP